MRSHHNVKYRVCEISLCRHAGDDGGFVYKNCQSYLPSFPKEKIKWSSDGTHLTARSGKDYIAHIVKETEWTQVDIAGDWKIWKKILGSNRGWTGKRHKTLMNLKGKAENDNRMSMLIVIVPRGYPELKRDRSWILYGTKEGHCERALPEIRLQTVVHAHVSQTP
jgi:hypothetical protein